MNLRILMMMATVLVMAASAVPASAKEPAKNSEPRAEKDAAQPDHAAADKSTADKPAADKSTADKPAADKPADPPADPSPSDEPAEDADAYRALLEQGAGQPVGDGEVQKPATPAGEVPMSSFWILFGGAGLIALGGWAYQKYRTGQTPNALVEMEHVRSMKLGTKHQLTIVEVEGRRLLLGLSDGHMQVLAELDAVPAARSSTALGSTALSQAASRQSDEDTWQAMLQEAIDSGPRPEGHDGLFRRTDADRSSRSTRNTRNTRSSRDEARSELRRASRANLESDSVVCGLESLKSQAGIKNWERS
jgi:flagellar biogenesis protein FliO